MYESVCRRPATEDDMARTNNIKNIAAPCYKFYNLLKGKRQQAVSLGLYVVGMVPQSDDLSFRRFGR